MPMELPEGAEATAATAEDAAGPADRHSLTLDCAHKLGQAVLGLLLNPLALEQATNDGSNAVVPPVAAHARIPNKAGTKKKRRFRSPSPTAAAALGLADQQHEQQQQASKHKTHKRTKHQKTEV